MTSNRRAFLRTAVAALLSQFIRVPELEIADDIVYLEISEHDALYIKLVEETYEKILHALMYGYETDKYYPDNFFGRSILDTDNE